MEAEARGFRSDLWKAVEEEAGGAHRRPLRQRLSFAVRTTAISLIMVMTIGLPMTNDVDVRSIGDSVQMLTSTESQILGALRRSLSSANTGRVIVALETTSPKNDEKPQVSRAEARPAPRPRERMASIPRAEAAPAKKPVQTVPKAVPASSASSPSIEDILSLMQVGERALRRSETSVIIIEQDPRQEMVQIELR